MGLLVAFGAVAVYCFFRWVVLRHRNHNANSGEPRNFYQYIRGQYLDTEKCVIQWGNCDTVGGTFTFTTKFYFNNGEPYPITEEELGINIQVGTTTIMHITEIRQADIDCYNEVKVSFAVRRSGTYKISLLCGTRPILNSPFTREFYPGTLAHEQTVLLRTTHSMLSVVTLVEEKTHQMEIIPRDSFDNNCSNNLSKLDLEENFGLQLVEINSLDYNPPFVWNIEKKYLSQRLVLNFTVFNAGCYKAELTYKQQPIKNGSFDVIVLTDHEHSEVDQNVHKKNLSVWFECRLLSNNSLAQMEDDVSHRRARGLSLSDVSPTKNSMTRKRLKSMGTSSTNKAKKVFCYITAKQLIIREYFLKIFFRRNFTFRLSPSTKLICRENDDESGLPVLLLDDGFQRVGLTCPRRNILAATFVGILFNNMGRSECYDEKVNYFHQQLLSHHQLSSGRDKVEFVIDRNDILNSSYRHLKDLSTSNWLKQFVIQFRHETGLDWGGLNREWIHLLCKAFFQPREVESGDGTAASGMFRKFKDDPQALVLPCASSVSGYKLKYYEVAGKLVGKCLLETALGGSNARQVTARFARSFLCQLVGLPVTFAHFESDDPDLFTNKVRYILDNDVTDDDEITFSEEEYSNEGKLLKVHELVPNGADILVNNENKHKYLDRMAQYRLRESVKSEIESFVKGLNAIVPDEMLGAFDENEVELLLCGSSKINVDDMKAHCVVSGHHGKVIEWFWALAASFTQAELARLLQFTTGCSHLPPDGFKSLEPPFKVSYSSYNDGALPTAHTCFNELCLPHYDSYEEMHRMLKIAITEGATGFGLV